MLSVCFLCSFSLLFFFCYFFHVNDPSKFDVKWCMKGHIFMRYYLFLALLLSIKGTNLMFILPIIIGRRHSGIFGWRWWWWRNIKTHKETKGHFKPRLWFDASRIIWFIPVAWWNQTTTNKREKNASYSLRPNEWLAVRFEQQLPFSPYR